MGNPEQIDMSLDRLLTTLSFFHVVKRLEKPWSKEVQCLCSCPDFFKNGACEHAIISTMLVDKTVKVPGSMSLREPKVTPTTLEGAMMAGTSSDSEASSEYGDGPGRPAIQV